METEEEIQELERVLKEDVSWEPPKSPLSRKYFWRDKDGKEVSYKEFISRWKEGIKGITPLQQTKTQLNSTLIMVLGLLCGIVMSVLAVETLWWLLIILVGGLFNTCVQWIGLWQKKKALEEVNLLLKGGFENE